MFVQDAFPELTPAERHLLSDGTCGSCFLRMHGHPHDELIETEDVSVLVRKTQEDAFPLIEICTDNYSLNEQALVHVTLNDVLLYHPDLLVMPNISIDVLMALDEWKPGWSKENAGNFLAGHAQVLQNNMLHAAIATLKTLLRQWEGPDPRIYEVSYECDN